jgi:hypothetical protein
MPDGRNFPQIVYETRMSVFISVDGIGSRRCAAGGENPGKESAITGWQKSGNGWPEDRVALDLEAIAAARYGATCSVPLRSLVAQAFYASSHTPPGYPRREPCHACISPDPGQ